MTALEELHGLLDRLCDQTNLSRAETARLAELLRENSHHRQAYLARMDLHATLWALGGNSAAIDRPPGPERAVASALPERAYRLEAVKHWISHPMSLSLLVAGLFLTTIVLALALVGMPTIEDRQTADETDRPTFVATLGLLQNCQWEMNATSRQPGDNIEQGETLELRAGLAEVRFDSGAMVLLEGPAKFTVRAPKFGVLEHGKLFARVPTPARGFTIATPDALVVDLGTEFGVKVNEERRQNVIVYQGEVEVMPRQSNGGASILVKAGEQLQFDDGQIQSRPQPHLPTVAATYQYLGALQPDAQNDRNDDTLTKLTDGEPGFAPFQSGSWSGVLRDPELHAADTPQPSLLFDLGESTSIDQIVVSYLVNYAGAVRAPQRIAVSVSDDGRAYRQVLQSVDFEDAPDLPNNGPGEPRRGVLRFRPTSARFVQIDFYNDFEWTFLGEITIRRSLFDARNDQPVPAIP